MRKNTAARRNDIYELKEKNLPRFNYNATILMIWLLQVSTRLNKRTANDTIQALRIFQ